MPFDKPLKVQIAEAIREQGAVLPLRTVDIAPGVTMIDGASLEARFSKLEVVAHPAPDLDAVTSRVSNCEMVVAGFLSRIKQLEIRAAVVGPAGPRGEKGEQGLRGIMGPQGDRGIPGLPGRSELAVAPTLTPWWKPAVIAIGLVSGSAGAVLCEIVLWLVRHHG